jgi:hypothetical protein
MHAVPPKCRFTWATLASCFTAPQQRRAGCMPVGTLLSLATSTRTSVAGPVHGRLAGVERPLWVEGGRPAVLPPFGKGRCGFSGRR